MRIEEAEKLGIEQATKESLKIIHEKQGLNAVLAVNDEPWGIKGSPSVPRDNKNTISSVRRDNKTTRSCLNVPYICKDNIVTLELPTTAGSKILEGFVSPYEATVATKLREAGAVMVGKSNLDEFAMGSSTENSAYGVTKNPVDETRVPGGSSGGSASAVASGMVPFALGSDTGGSIRQPASFCGVVGLMPTYGRVSRYGLIAMASSLDRIGPITTCVEDSARVLQIIAGHDKHDSTTMNIEVPDYVSALDGDIKGLKIGVPKEYFGEGVDKGIVEAVRQAIETLKNSGAIVQEISLPNSKYALSVYYIIQPSEVSSNLARFDGIRYGVSAQDTDNLWEVYDKSRAQGFGAEVKRRIMLGTYTLSAGFRDAYYDKAQRVRALIKQEFDSVFEQVDVIISPTTPTVAFKIGERAKDPLSMYKADLLTTPASLAGIPAISVPCGEIDGLPVGLQIMGRQFDEKTILRVAYAYEQEMKKANHTS